MGYVLWRRFVGFAGMKGGRAGCGLIGRLNTMPRTVTNSGVWNRGLVPVLRG